jgi:hypothetical protein
VEAVREGGDRSKFTIAFLAGLESLLTTVFVCITLLRLLDRASPLPGLLSLENDSCRELGMTLRRPTRGQRQSRVIECRRQTPFSGYLAWIYHSLHHPPLPGRPTTPTCHPALFTPMEIGTLQRRKEDKTRLHQSDSSRVQTVRHTPHSSISSPNM